MREIKFKGRNYLLCDDFSPQEGYAICTPLQYKNFRPSYAHYYPVDDIIYRFGKVIGTGKDIKLGKKVKAPAPTMTAMYKGTEFIRGL